jgi:CDP-diacylglycerol--serine O-phosphatidyltransferase
MEKTRTRTELYLIPNFLTLANVFFGYLSILSTFHEKYKWAAIWIFLAAIMDAFDGIVARLVKTSTVIGIQLDSLADVVSFGTATSFLIYFWAFHWIHPASFGIFFSFVFLAGGLLRLARYNTLQMFKPDRKYYVGLTVPSASLLLAAIVFCDPQPVNSKLYTFLISFLVILLTACMVSTIKYRNFLYFRLQKRIALRTAFLYVIVFASLVSFPKIFLPLCFSVNVIVGLVEHLIGRLKRQKQKKAVRQAND